jgi:hypothetical protein
VNDIDIALAACRDATIRFIDAAEKSGPAWGTSPAPGKWCPGQIVEHVARALEESACVAEGRPAKFPRLPALLHPVMRQFFFRRVLKNGVFPKAKTNKAMDPLSGPATPAEGRARLEAAYAKFDVACRRLGAGDGLMRTTIFGAVPAPDYVRFMTMHTAHHEKQLPRR